MKLNANGTIRVPDPVLRVEAVEVLGLDAPLLVLARIHTLDVAIRRAVKPKQLQRLARRYEATEGQLPPFPSLILPWLRRRITKEAAIRRDTRP